MKTVNHKHIDSKPVGMRGLMMLTSNYLKIRSLSMS